ncbi:MAG: CDP-glycerol glycerophosphotransferase family protein [Marinifilaceae bacterium]|jgi:CDP-glycerol glycerophosphotransferase (TagB/SpsB family)|nr:CDP-glycerol glycerophosphotransferase family protein [Marinifilaceae bacterium]
MKAVLLCQQPYSFSILEPICLELQSRDIETIWFLKSGIEDKFPYKGKYKYTCSMQEIYNLKPDMIFAPGNSIPYYLSGVKVSVFHGYAAEKGDQFRIRSYFDMYLTQGPFFTKEFQKLEKKHKNFKVVETGWSRQDTVYKSLNLYSDYKNKLLSDSNKKKIVLYAPTFSPSCTSAFDMNVGLEKLVKERECLVLVKLHDKTSDELKAKYRKLAKENKNILYIEDTNILRYLIAADIMISDTSSVIYEFLLLDKPVITYNTIGKNLYWKDIKEIDEITEAYDQVQDDQEYIDKRKWIVNNYDPYIDGNSSKRMVDAVVEYISENGVPENRKLSFLRRRKSKKIFGKIKK